MSSAPTLARLATVRRIEERRALHAVAVAQREAASIEALDARIARLLGAGASSGPATAQAWSSAMGGRDRLSAAAHRNAARGGAASERLAQARARHAAASRAADLAADRAAEAAATAEASAGDAA